MYYLDSLAQDGAEASPPRKQNEPPDPGGSSRVVLVLASLASDALRSVDWYGHELRLRHTEPTNDGIPDRSQCFHDADTFPCDQRVRLRQPL